MIYSAFTVVFSLFILYKMCLLKIWYTLIYKYLQRVLKFIKNVPCVEFFFHELSFLWCKICTIMNTNIPMSDEIYQKCTFFGGEELLKWRKCLQCDEIWSNISNRIMRGRVGPYGGQEQLLLKSWRKYLECAEIPMIKHQ